MKAIIIIALLIFGGIGCIANGGENVIYGIICIAIAAIWIVIKSIMRKEKEEKESISTRSNANRAASGGIENKGIGRGFTVEQETDFSIPVNNKDLDEAIAAKRALLMELNDEVLYQSFGLYQPKYPFTTVDGFKDKLADVRQRQKQMIRDKIACAFPNDITYNNSLAEGKKIVADWVKLMLRAFNGECDTIIMKAKFNNMDQLEKRIRKAAEEISNIGSRMRIRLNESYIQLKIDELHVAYEYEMFKQQEKERLQAIREEEREKAKLEKELQERRAKIIKDQKHVSTEIQELSARLSTATGQEAENIRARIVELNEYSEKLEQDMQEVELRAQQARAGYVYIISNIGSFGEDVYKIGLTRRMNPQERVDELGDASVPFRLDVHALVFSEDAVALETALHHKFEHKRVNMVNSRKEFFRVSIDEIEAEVKANFSQTVEFTKLAAAQEYRESVRIIENMSA